MLANSMLVKQRACSTFTRALVRPCKWHHRLHEHVHWVSRAAASGLEPKSAKTTSLARTAAACRSPLPVGLLQVGWAQDMAAPLLARCEHFPPGGRRHACAVPGRASARPAVMTRPVEGVRAEEMV